MKRRSPESTIKYIKDQIEKLAFSVGNALGMEDPLYLYLDAVSRPGATARSVQPDWCRALPLQQQSVLFLAARGPDGCGKDHPIKELVRPYRAEVLAAARYGRPLQPTDQGDGFMDLRIFDLDREMYSGEFMAHRQQFIELDWQALLGQRQRDLMEKVLRNIDSVPHHYIMHLAHGAQILGYKHPDQLRQDFWGQVYCSFVEDLHLNPESEEAMDARLNDWGMQDWDA